MEWQKYIRATFVSSSDFKCGIKLYFLCLSNQNVLRWCTSSLMTFLLVFPQVSLSVPGLPVLEKGESYSCFFQESHSPATVTETGVTCHSPDTRRVPVVPPGQGESFLTPNLSVCCFGSLNFITGLNFSTLWLKDLTASYNEIHLCVCVFLYICVTCTHTVYNSIHVSMNLG